MQVRAADLLMIADELRGHAVACGHDLNSAHMFAHLFLMRALAGETAFAPITEQLRELAREAKEARADGEVKAA